MNFVRTNLDFHPEVERFSSAGPVGAAPPEISPMGYTTGPMPISGGLAGGVGGGDENLMKEMEAIQVRVVWELDNWKKMEEARFKFTLKEKEIEYLNNLAEIWKKKEMEREKVFKRGEASIMEVEKKIKAKLVELQKREQQLVLLDEELKKKISEASRHVQSSWRHG
jgi:hypothetical protein